MLITSISKDCLIYGDPNYVHAVNYSHMYNYPITLNYGEKHNRTKYIINAGTSDIIELWKDGIFIYVLSQNNGLSYISLQVINTEVKEEEGIVFLEEEDCTLEGSYSEGILDKDSREQIKILMEYL